MMNRKKAFTLIELLVVIAIIAILAAILFPVFAQAKVAAKFATTVSNMKQTGTALNIYLADTDDTLPWLGNMNGNGSSWSSGACYADIGCPTWDKLLIPYTKNLDIMDTSLDRTPRQSTNRGPGTFKRSFRAASNFIRSWGGGTTWGGGTWYAQPLNFSAIPAPSSSIAFLEQRNSQARASNNNYPFEVYWEQWVWSAGSANTVSNLAVDQPGVNAADLFYAGVDYSAASGKAAFAMGDTSVKSRPLGYIFEGYRRSRSWNAPVDPALRGVCVDGDVGGPASNDCPLPQ